MVIDPITIATAAGAIGKAFGGDKGGQAPQPSNVFTPEMLQNAINMQQQYMSQQNALAGTGSYAPGGVNTQQARQLSPQEIKIREYTNYLVTKKGYTPENAQARAQQIAASSQENFKQDKEFSRFVRQGGSSSLKKGQGGGIKTKGPEFASGGASVSSESELMRQAMQNLGLQSLGAASGLPGMYGAEEQRALQARSMLGNQAMGYLNQGIGSSGLYSTQEEALANMKNKYLDDFSSVYEDTMRRATSDLTGSGFNSSNLAGEYMKDNAYDTQSDFLTDALAKLAGQEQNFLTQASGIGAQNLQNLLSTFGSVGQQQGIGSVLGGVLNPAGAGLFTDTSAAEMANMLQQQGITNRRADQQMANQINLQPVTLMPEQPGFFESMVTKLSPIAGQAIYDHYKGKGKTQSS